ncbi:MAG: peptide deformylase [Acidobacteria bacterium]|nr:peptide deformylase [Acidobacteriota bacterium]
MAVLAIRTLGDPVLRTPAEPVASFDADLRRLVSGMFETMEAAPGVGLAAPQVGVPRRLFVFDSGEERGAVANPVFAWRSEDTQEGEEGCLSLPGLYFPVVRASSVRIEGVDAYGVPVALEGGDLLARIFQHESDHLDGVLFVDRLGPEHRREAMRLLRDVELGLAAPPAVRGRAL